MKLTSRSDRSVCLQLHIVTVEKCCNTVYISFLSRKCAYIVLHCARHCFGVKCGKSQLTRNNSNSISRKYFISYFSKLSLHSLMKGTMTAKNMILTLLSVFHYVLNLTTLGPLDFKHSYACLF